MRLTRKFVLALVIAIGGIMAVDALLQLRREVALFEDDMAQDEQALGQAVRVAIETVAAMGGVDQARALVERVGHRQARVTARWVWLDDPANSLSAAERAQIRRGEELHRVQDDPGGERQQTFVPLDVGGPRRAALELSESLRPQRAFLRRTQLEILATLIVLVVLCGGATVVLGVMFVARPLDALARQARRIGAGDLSHRLGIRQRDEIGCLAAEFDTMCDRLEAAQEQIRRETDARIATLHQLRHADRLKTVGQLASGVAHELGTPLNVVSGRAKLIAASGSAADDVTRGARIIAEQADRMAAIIRQLLDFARRRGRRAEVGDLRDVVTRTVEMLAVLARSRNVTVALTVAPEPMPLRMDAGQLEQALTNIVVNAIQAMPGQGVVRVEAGPHPEPGPGPRWRIVVEDDGAGIPPDHLSHLFEPFFTTKGVGEGTGLGLAVAHGILTEHGGAIHVTSRLGEGSRFEIVFDAEVDVERREVVCEA